MDELIHLNVGGTQYMTVKSTLLKYPESIFEELYEKSCMADIVTGGKLIFVDRDGAIFRYILDYMRTNQLTGLNTFNDLQLMKREAEFYKLKSLINILNDKLPSVITVGYRGTFAFGRDGLADVKFRKLTRIIVCGRVNACRDVFKDTLNDSRDPSGSGDRYSSRFFLKHNNLEQAFEQLYDSGYNMVGSCGSGTNSSGTEIKPGQDTEENKWQHYNEFVFARPFHP